MLLEAKPVQRTFIFVLDDQLIVPRSLICCWAIVSGIFRPVNIGFNHFGVYMTDFQ